MALARDGWKGGVGVGRELRRWRQPELGEGLSKLPVLGKVPAKHHCRARLATPRHVHLSAAALPLNLVRPAPGQHALPCGQARWLAWIL